jgi:tetratricopeptide (TPR) repeat protein
MSVSDSPLPIDGSTAADHPVLLGERVAFTGTLASMTHRQAADLVVQHGGQATQHVGQQTTLLVIGEEGWPLEADGQPSVKLQQAQHWQERGSPLRVLSESEWLQAIGMTAPERQKQWLTPAMLSQLLQIPVTRIRQWERAGWIQPVRRVLRLPYFDMQDVIAIRRLSELIESGVTPHQLSASLERLRTVLPDIDRPLAQLQLLRNGHRVEVCHRGQWMEARSGQRLLPFDATEDASTPDGSDGQSLLPHSTDEDPVILPWQPPELSPGRALLHSHRRHALAKEPVQRTAQQWFDLGVALSEAGELDPAVEALRLALIDEPGHADWQFQLADVLYRQGNALGAIERYYSAIEHDPRFLEAWTQLGCALAEVGQRDAAQQALEIALDLHPDFPDAHFHLAQLLDRGGESTAAAEHWSAYLHFDERGPWADLARQRLDAMHPSSS